jgi:hypothetical protein
MAGVAPLDLAALGTAGAVERATLPARPSPPPAHPPLQSRRRRGPDPGSRSRAHCDRRRLRWPPPAASLGFVEPSHRLRRDQRAQAPVRTPERRRRRSREAGRWRRGGLPGSRYPPRRSAAHRARRRRPPEARRSASGHRPQVGRSPRLPRAACGACQRPKLHPDQRIGVRGPALCVARRNPRAVRDTARPCPRRVSVTAFCQPAGVGIRRLAGEEGFEPSDGGSKVRCLTTWRLPNGTSILPGDRVSRRLGQALVAAAAAATSRLTAAPCRVSQSVTTSTNSTGTSSIGTCPAPSNS